MDNEAEARRATSLLYHVASAVTFAWEGRHIPEMRGGPLPKQMLVDENAIVKIRKDMPLELAPCCGVITGYGAVVNTARVQAGETVAVIGCGGVGMAAINGAEIRGAGRIIAIDTNPAKLQLATKLGATDIIDPRNGDVVQQVSELTAVRPEDRAARLR